MKRVLSVILALAMCVSLIACAGTTTAPTAPTTTPNKSYTGKKLRILGVGTNDNYTNFENFRESNNYLWMMKAAMVEWAELNGVTLEFKGRYSGSTATAMVAGADVDIIIGSNVSPRGEVFGSPQTPGSKITSALTEMECKLLSNVCGDNYVNAVRYGGQVYGVVLPWSELEVLGYNKSMFERYNLKTPREYFLEGNWTWETFYECLSQTTRDTNGDGTIDSYGLGSTSGLAFDNLVNPWKTDSDGRVISVMDEPWMQDFIQLKYNAYNKRLYLPKKTLSILKNVTTDMFAMQLYPGMVYDMSSAFQTIRNGDQFEVVPFPEWKGDNGAQMPVETPAYLIASLAINCKEREAALDMLAYVLQCGMKYMSDFSLGMVPCDYPGVQGTCDLSLKWKNAFAQVCADRAEAYKNLSADDADYLKKINEYISENSLRANGTYKGIDPVTGYEEIVKKPPASSIPAIKSKYQAALDKYNEHCSSQDALDNKYLGK